MISEAAIFLASGAALVVALIVFGQRRLSRIDAINDAAASQARRRGYGQYLRLGYDGEFYRDIA